MQGDKFPDVGQILGTKLETFLVSSLPEDRKIYSANPCSESVLFDMITVPTESRLLVLEERGQWVKVLILGRNLVGWFEKNDCFALYLYCQKPNSV